MSERPQLWMLVGGDGAGKRTFCRLMLQPLGLPFVNADLLAQLVFSSDPKAYSYEAAQLAARQRQRLRMLQEGVSFCFETVVSHPSKIDFVARAKALGYRIIMILIHLESADLNQVRIASRVSEGGHTVPAEQVISRIPRLLEQVRALIPLVDELRIVDNSSALDPFQPALTISDGNVLVHREPLPGWAVALLLSGTSG